MVLAELSAVVSGGDSQDAWTVCGGVQSTFHGGLYGIRTQAVDHDFVDGLTVLG